jgi:hypothetical protein
MVNKKLSFVLAFALAFLIFACPFLSPAPLYSPAWGFRVDLPEGYEYTGGDRKDRFSFENAEGAKFDIIVYYAAPGRAAPYASVDALAQDVKRRLNSRGDIDSFEYRRKKTCVIELSFSVPGAGGRASPMSGWALCAELGTAAPGTPAARAPAGPRPMLLAMAYGPAGKQELRALHFSALDSLAPEESDCFAPGPITEFSYPREKRVKAPVFGLDADAWIYEEDAEAAQALVDREFLVLRRYQNAPNWKEAWARFYRAIYRDSFDRLADIAFQVERKLNVPPRDNRDFADQVLRWVQSFKYERNFMGSDFVNCVTAAVEGRGDCDSRSMLWAIILKQAGIPSAIMVSRSYSHAMGLADLSGTGARFEVQGKKLLVAETTAKVSIGLIGEQVSEISQWLGILFE